MLSSDPRFAVQSLYVHLAERKKYSPGMGECKERLVGLGASQVKDEC